MMSVLLIPFLMHAQEDDAKYRMVELSYMKAKPGMNKKFEDAVKKHNEKYHKEGVYASELYTVITGDESGWYVWTMGALTFTDLDGRPGDGDHAEDWQKNVDPFVAEYGRVEYWRWNEKLSNWKESDEDKITLWWMDIERGEGYRFRNFMMKIQEVYVEKDEEINVYNNEFYQDNGRDVVVVWPLEKWADLDKDDWKMKDEYEKKNGEGSWTTALEEWDDFIAGMSQEVWRML